MALVKNDIGPISARGIINVVLIVGTVVLLGFIVYKQLSKVLYPAAVDSQKCADDPNYEYKDPAKHPNDC